jgi:hypothetical protein
MALTPVHLEATRVGTLSAQLSRPRTRATPSAEAPTPAVYLRVTEKLGGHPKGGNSLKSLQEIRTRSRQVDPNARAGVTDGQSRSRGRSP